VAKFVSQGDASFEVDIPEKDVSKMKIGSKVKITCDAYPGKEFWGEVHEIAPTVKEKTRTTEVKVSVPNDDGKLRSGMFARGEVVLSETSDAILVPPDSVIALGTDTKLVPLVKPSATKQGQGVIELRQVTIAQTTSKFAVISSGIKADELVVVETQGQLSDGLPVQYTENAPDPTPTAAAAATGNSGH
jgi:membrane fusion protein (multidrug efflux system)